MLCDFEFGDRALVSLLEHQVALAEIADGSGLGLTRSVQQTHGALGEFLHVPSAILASRFEQDSDGIFGQQVGKQRRLLDPALIEECLSPSAVHVIKIQLRTVQVDPAIGPIEQGCVHENECGFAGKVGVSGGWCDLGCSSGTLAQEEFILLKRFINAGDVQVFADGLNGSPDRPQLGQFARQHELGAERPAFLLGLLPKRVELALGGTASG